MSTQREKMMEMEGVTETSPDPIMRPNPFRALFRTRALTLSSPANLLSYVVQF